MPELGVGSSHRMFQPQFFERTLTRLNPILSIVTTPTELIKIRQQSLLTKSTAREVGFQILKEGGLPSLYRGITATAMRDCGYGAYFAAVCYIISIFEGTTFFDVLSQVRNNLPIFLPPAGLVRVLCYL